MLTRKRSGLIDVNRMYLDCPTQVMILLVDRSGYHLRMRCPPWSSVSR